VHVQTYHNFIIYFFTFSGRRGRRGGRDMCDGRVLSSILPSHVSGAPHTQVSCVDFGTGNYNQESIANDSF